MKDRKNAHRSNKKVLFGSTAVMAALGLVATSPKVVDAATTPANQTASKKRTAKSTAVPASLTKEESNTAADQGYAINTEATGDQETNPNTSADSSTADNSTQVTHEAETKPNPTETAPEKQPSSTENEAKQPTAGVQEVKAGDKIIKATVNGLNLSYNQDTDELTIDGGIYKLEDIIQQKNGLGKWLLPDDGAGLSLAKVKKIKFTATTKLVKGAAAYFFYGLTELTEISGLDKLDTSSVTNMSYMFSNCSKLTTLDLRGFDTSNVTDMNSMFSYCTKLTRVDLSSFNTSKVTCLDSIFQDAESLPTVNMSNFKLPELVSLTSAFQNCYSLVEFTFPDDTPKLDQVSYMFLNCRSLVKLDLRKFNNITAMPFYGDNSCGGMLKGLTSLNTLTLGKKSGLSNSWHIVFDTGFDNDGLWQQVDSAHGGTVFNPKGKRNLTSEQVMELYQYKGNDNQHPDDPIDLNQEFVEDTYVRLGGPITVHHVNEAGKPLPEMPDTQLFGPIGDSYTLNAEEIPGYDLVGGDKVFSGVYGPDKEVTAIYRLRKEPGMTAPEQAANVTVHYQDENGRELAPTDTMSGKLGDGYVTAAKEIPGYKLTVRPENATGFFSGVPQSVVYVYTAIETETEGEQASASKKKKKNRGNGHGQNSQDKTGANSTGENGVNGTDAANGADDELPETGTSVKEELAMLAMGSIVLAGSLAAAWFNRKKD